MGAEGQGRNNDDGPASLSSGLQRLSRPSKGSCAKSDIHKRPLTPRTR